MTLAVVVAMALATQALGFRVRAVSKHRSGGQPPLVASNEPNWTEFGDAVDNGINAILSLQDIRFPQGKDRSITDTLKSLVGPVKAVVPFIPPPAGLAVGGALSLVSGIFGWGEDDGMGALSKQLEMGFAKVNQKLDNILDTLSLLQQAVARVEAMTREILDRVVEIKHMLDMATIHDVHAEYNVVMRKMATAAQFPEQRASVMQDTLAHIKGRTGGLLVKLESNFTPAKVESIVMGVYTRNGNGGKCQARELLDDILSVRLEAYALLMLTVMDPNTGEVNQPFSWMHTEHLREHLEGYKKLRQTVQGRSDLPWDWSPFAQGKESACAGGEVNRIGSDSNSGSGAASKCAADARCVGTVTNSWGRFEYNRIVNYWLFKGVSYRSHYYSNGTCFGPTWPNACQAITHDRRAQCWQYRAKVYRKCWD